MDGRHKRSVVVVYEEFPVGEESACCGRVVHQTCGPPQRHLKAPPGVQFAALCTACAASDELWTCLACVRGKDILRMPMVCEESYRGAKIVLADFGTYYFNYV